MKEFRVSLQTLFSFVSLAALAHAAASPAPVTLQSPDKAIAVKIEFAPGVSYSVSFHGRPVVLASKLGLTIREAPVFGGPLTVGKPAFRQIDETYRLFPGKAASARNHCNEVTVRLEGPAPARAAVELSFRAYNDGVAFRYVVPRQAALSTITLTDEDSEFVLAGDPKAHILPFRNFTSSHEGVYQHLRVSEINREAAPLIDMPALFEISGDTWLAITEADLDDYAGMYLSKVADTKATLRSALSPRPDEPSVKVRVQDLMTSPWRVLMIGDAPGRLIESNLVSNLNPPLALTDTSWIKPGKTTWHWWNGTIADGLGAKAGLNTETMKYYIDFCARNGIAYHALVDQDDHGWYGPSRGDVANLDVTKAIPEIDLPEIFRYAKEKGVGIRVWLHWLSIWDPEKMERAFTEYEKWGVNGFMVDLMDRDDQEMVRFRNRVIKRAAAHHMTVVMHGAYKPTGMGRTYPNLLNIEGALNLEFLKWSTLCDPPLHVTHAYTRMLAGPMDYHLGGFRSAPRATFLPQMKRPKVLGTRAHQLALYVVYENPLAMVSDYPDAYEGSPGFDFIREVPVSWDETKVLGGTVGEYITIARRRGDDWYVGSITDWNAREIHIPLGFLGNGEYTAEIYRDSEKTAEDPNQVAIEKRSVTAGTVLVVDMESGGGHVVRLRRTR